MMHRVKEEIDYDDDGIYTNYKHNNSTLPSSSSHANHPSIIVIKKEEEEKEGCPIHHDNHLEFINCENCRKVSRCKADDDDDKTKIALTSTIKRECIKSEYEQDCGCNECLVDKNAAVVASTSTFATTVHQINDSTNVNDWNLQEPQNYETERDNSNSNEYHDYSCPTPDYIPPFFSDDEEEEEDESSSNEDNMQQPETSHHTSSHSASNTSHNNDRIKSPNNEEMNHDIQNDFLLALVLDANLNRRRSARSVATKPKTNLVVESSSNTTSDFGLDKCSDSEADSEKPKMIRKRTLSCRKPKSPVSRKSNAKIKSPKTSQAQSNQPKHNNDETQGGVDEKVSEAEDKKPSLQSFIVVASLQCWLCDHSAPNETKFNDHLLTKHKLQQYRCMMHKCDFSTHHNIALTNHLKTSHGDHTTIWPCTQCSHKTKSYAKLRIHFKHFHQQGTFRCGFEDCHFAPTTIRRDVKNHLAAVHRCPVVSCARLLSRDALTKHKIHAHSVQPKRELIRHKERFHCLWHKCSYRMEKLEDVLVHVRNSHFKDGDERDPADFVEMRDALTMSNKKELNSHRPQEENQKEDNKKESNIRAIAISLRCWLCKRSDRTFKDKLELNNHLFVVHGLDRFRCVAWVCGASFSDRDQLNQHIDSEHKDNHIWSCDKCQPPKHKKRFFVSYGLLARHIYDSHQYGHFKCTVDDCDYESTCNRITFCAHFDETHAKQNKKPDSQALTNQSTNGQNCNYSCDSSCDRYEKRKSSSESDAEDDTSHSDSDHSEAIKQKVVKRKRSKNAGVLTVRLNCPIDGCTEHRPDKSELNAHLLEAHRVKKHRCYIPGCRASFDLIREYTKHLIVDHTADSTIGGYNCTKCDYLANTVAALRVHIHTYHEEGIFRCPHPGCQFVSHTNRQKVQGHQYCHKPLRYKCTNTGCDQAFRESKSLRNHLKNHETGMFEGCPQCGRHFARLDLFKRHLKIHSKTKAKQQDGFQCGWKGCKYFVSQRAQLKPHLVEQHFVGDAKYGKITDRIEMIRAVKSFTKVIRAKKK